MPLKKLSFNIPKYLLESMDELLEKYPKEHESRTEFINHGISLLVKEMNIKEDVEKTINRTRKLTPTEKRFLKLKTAIKKYPGKHLTQSDLNALISEVVFKRNKPVKDDRTFKIYTKLALEHGLLFSIPGYDVVIYTKNI